MSKKESLCYIEKYGEKTKACETTWIPRQMCMLLTQVPYASVVHLSFQRFHQLIMPRLASTYFVLRGKFRGGVNP